MRKVVELTSELMDRPFLRLPDLPSRHFGTSDSGKENLVLTSKLRTTYCSHSAPPFHSSGMLVPDEVREKSAISIESHEAWRRERSEAD